MKRLLCVGVAAAIAAASSVAWSQGAPPTPEQQAKAAIETRQGLFKLLNQQFGPVAGMLRNQVPFDAALVAKNSARIEVLAGVIPELFVLDTRQFTGTATKSLDGIWNSQPDFKAKSDGLAKAAAELTAAARSGDRAATLKAAGEVGRACGACHDSYRAK